jgi:hypothetical protein
LEELTGALTSMNRQSFCLWLIWITTWLLSDSVCRDDRTGASSCSAHLQVGPCRRLPPCLRSAL